MPATIHYGGRVLLAGNSIATDVYWGPQAMDAIDAQIPSLTGQRRATVTGAPATVVGGGASVASSTYHPVIVRINTGSPGSAWSGLAADVPGFITSHTPDCVWIYSGVNEVPDQSAVEFAGYVDSTLSQIRAWSASVPILCVSILCRGELWAAGPVWNNFYDTKIDEFNSIIQAACVTYGCTYVDTRPASLAYEAANNPIPSVSGILTIDQIHPSVAGNGLIAGLVVAGCSVVP